MVITRCNLSNFGHLKGDFALTSNSAWHMSWKVHGTRYILHLYLCWKCEPREGQLRDSFQDQSHPPEGNWMCHLLHSVRNWLLTDTYWCWSFFLQALYTASFVWEQITFWNRSHSLYCKIPYTLQQQSCVVVLPNARTILRFSDLTMGTTHIVGNSKILNPIRNRAISNRELYLATFQPSTQLFPDMPHVHITASDEVLLPADIHQES